MSFNAYVNVNSWQREYSGVRQLLEHVSEELLSSLVPRDRVQLITLQVVKADKGCV